LLVNNEEEGSWTGQWWGVFSALSSEENPMSVDPKFLVRESLPTLQQGAALNLKLYGELAPVVFLNRNGQIQMTAVQIQDDNDKSLLVAYIREQIYQNRICEYGILFEAWFVDPPEGELDKVLDHKRKASLESFPGRQEMACMLYANPGEERMYQAMILGEGKERRLGEWKEESLKDAAMGRFVNLWQKGKAATN
jgi:hypothetical protein